MEAKERLSDNWEKDFWKSIVEHDVMELRNKLNDIHIFTANKLQSININSNKDAGNMN